MPKTSRLTNLKNCQSSYCCQSWSSKHRATAAAYLLPKACASLLFTTSSMNRSLEEDGVSRVLPPIFLLVQVWKCSPVPDLREEDSLGVQDNVSK